MGLGFLRTESTSYADLHLINEREVLSSLVYPEINKLNSSSLGPGPSATFRLCSHQVLNEDADRFFSCTALSLLPHSDGFGVEWTESVKGKTSCIWASGSLWKKSGIDFLPSRCPEWLLPHVPRVDGERARGHDHLRL